MGAGVVAQISAVMKEKILPKISDAFAYPDALCARFPLNAGIRVGTRATRIQLRAAPGGISGGVDLDGGSNVVGTADLFDVATVTTTARAHTRQLTRRAIEATKSDSQAFLNYLKDQVGKSMQGYKWQLDREMQRDDSAVLATLVSNTAGSVYRTHDLTTPSNTPFGSQLIYDNNAYDIYDSTLATLRAGGPYFLLQQGGVDYVNRKATFTAAITGYAANDVMVVTGKVNDGIFGLDYHLKSSTSGSWQSILRTNPYVVPRSVDAGGAMLALDHIRLAKNAVILRKGSSELPAKLTPYTNVHQIHAYENLVQSVMVVNKTPAGNQSADLFFDNMTMLGMKPMENANARPDHIKFLEMGTYGWTVLKPLGFYEDPDGATVFPVYSTTNGVPKNSFWFQVDAEMQFYCQDVTNQVFISGLGIPSGYLPTS